MPKPIIINTALRSAEIIAATIFAVKTVILETGVERRVSSVLSIFSVEIAVIIICDARRSRKKTIISIDMSKYSTVAVIYGCDSSEWEVSCRSGEFVASRIDGNVYDVYEIFARFGKWSLVAYKKRNSMRVTFPEGARPEVDKVGTDFLSLFNGNIKSILLLGIRGTNG